MTTSEETRMTTIDKTGASDAEFRARVAVFDAAPTPDECDPERVEAVARALARHEPQYHDGYLTGEPDFFSCGADDDTGRGCEWVSDPESEDDYATQHRRHLAAAAIAADPSPAELAVKRVEVLDPLSYLSKREEIDEHARGWNDALRFVDEELCAALDSPAPAPQGRSQIPCRCGTDFTTCAAEVHT